MAAFVTSLGDIARGLAAIGLAALPARYWQRCPFFPVEQRTLPSALLTIAAGLALGIPGFFAYAERTGAIAAEQALEVAGRQAAGQLPADAALTYAPLAAAMFAPLAFALFTPLGLLATYLTLSGLARVFSCVTLAPFGDPLLTGIDALARRSDRRRRERASRRLRERAEGADAPDRLYEGAWAGLPDVDLVVVAARRKPGWDPGAFVITPEQWYTLGVPFDLQLPEGLRTVYPLTAQTSNEVLRRGVQYELPALRRGARGSG